MTDVALVRIVFLSNILSFNVTSFRDLMNIRLVNTSWCESIEYYGQFTMWLHVGKIFINPHKILQLFTKDSMIWLIRNCIERGCMDLLRKEKYQDQSPLHIAAGNGATKVIEYLVRDSGYPTEIRDYMLRTPLFEACSHDHRESVNVLLEYGANIDALDSNKATPLYIACIMGKERCVRALLSKKTLPKIRGLSPLHISAQNNRLECIRALLDAGYSPNLINENQESPLHLACSYGHNKCVNALLIAGANCDSTTSFGSTSLIYAARGGCTICIQLLLDAGASKEMMNQNGETALSQACFFGNMAVAELLIKAGCNKQWKNKEFASLEDIVRRRKYIFKNILQ